MIKLDEGQKVYMCLKSYAHPGGCEIGPETDRSSSESAQKHGRKDKRRQQRGFIHCEADKLKGCDIQLDYPSVGATENIMLASVFADGETIIRNAAKEPEILDLQNYLQATESV